MNRRRNNKGLALLAAVVGICFVGALIFFLTRDGENETPEEDAVPSETSAAVEQAAEGSRSGQQQRCITTRTIEVGNQWHEVTLTPRSWFQLEPQRPVRVRLLDGREFTKVPGDSLDIGETIPGFSISICSALPPDSGKTKVVVSEWQKDS